MSPGRNHDFSKDYYTTTYPLASFYFPEYSAQGPDDESQQDCRVVVTSPPDGTCEDDAEFEGAVERLDSSRRLFRSNDSRVAAKFEILMPVNGADGGTWASVVEHFVHSGDKFTQEVYNRKHSGTNYQMTRFFMGWQ